MHADGQTAGARVDIIAAERALFALVELAAGIEREQMCRNDRAAAKYLKYVGWPIRPAKRHCVSPFRMAYAAPSRGQKDQSPVCGSWPEISENDIDAVPQMLLSSGCRTEIPVEDRRQRVHIRKIEESERRNRDVKFRRIDVVAEYAGAASALQKIADHVQQGGVHSAYLPRPTQIFGFLQVLTDQQRYELRVRGVVIHREFDEAAHALNWRQPADIESAFLVADMHIGLFENRKPEGLLVPKIMIEHALADVGASRNLVHASAGQSVG